MLRLIGLTIKGIILLTVTIVVAQFITLSDDTWTSISTWATMDNLAGIVGVVAVIFVLVVVSKVLGAIGGLFSRGGGSYSAPSRSIARTPSVPTAAPAPKAAKKGTWYYTLTLADPSKPRKAGTICPWGTVKASDYSEAMALVHNKEKNKLNMDNAFRSKMVINEVSERVLQAVSFKPNC